MGAYFAIDILLLTFVGNFIFGTEFDAQFLMTHFEVSGINIRKIYTYLELIFEQKSKSLLPVDPCSQNCTTEVMLIYIHSTSTYTLHTSMEIRTRIFSRNFLWTMSTTSNILKSCMHVDCTRSQWIEIFSEAAFSIPLENNHFFTSYLWNYFLKKSKSHHGKKMALLLKVS